MPCRALRSTCDVFVAQDCQPPHTQRHAPSTVQQQQQHMDTAAPAHVPPPTFSPSFLVLKISCARRYFAMVRLELQPLLTPPAEALLSTYYQQQRQAADRSAARTTIRMLESAIRLSQAHARLCFRSSVVVLDACVAISLLEGMARSASVLIFRRLQAALTPCLQRRQRSRLKWEAEATRCTAM